MDVEGLVEKLREGVRSIGLHEDNSTELYDIEDAGEAMMDAAEALSRQKAAGEAEAEESYEIGKRDGYEEAIQDLDLATGGDGEFYGSTFPGETVDVPVMKARIIARFNSIGADREY